MSWLPGVAVERMARRAIKWATDSLDAEVGAVVGPGSVEAVIGLPAGTPCPTRTWSTWHHRNAKQASLPGLGTLPGADCAVRGPEQLAPVRTPRPPFHARRTQPGLGDELGARHGPPREGGVGLLERAPDAAGTPDPHPTLDRRPGTDSPTCSRPS